MRPKSYIIVHLDCHRYDIRMARVYVVDQAYSEKKLCWSVKIMTLFISITMFSKANSIVQNIPQKIVSPTKHCYGSE